MSIFSNAMLSNGALRGDLRWSSSLVVALAINDRFYNETVRCNVLERHSSKGFAIGVVSLTTFCESPEEEYLRGTSVKTI